ncbi:Transcriptional regulatory protein moc3 [Lasiodiplodia theobromae]|uniref:Transcriptional regulatory protein moc3 n=2 Tax=Lasiodiplodia theobromae TaxID=45133 RepID=A0A5N5DIY8_9PEZI|nr:Transcriptional regulatory protein moc3 [Lasiodiplodia theobromae]
MRSYIVRFKETRQPEAPAVAIPKPTARQIRTRTGCAQCKRRRVKCDEQQPACQRCRARDEKCSGPVVVPRWQTIVLAQDSSDNGLVQYWTTAVCGSMPLELHKPELLPDVVLPLLDRSPALLHCIRGVAIAHRGFFSTEALPASLRETSHALAALRTELAIHDDPHRTLLAALGLSILSVWLDPSSQDSSSLLHLRGASSVLHLLLLRVREANTQCLALTDFMVGLYVYIDMIHSYAVPAAHPLPLSGKLASRLASSAGYVHPITGIATGLCLVVARVGRYLRSVVDLHRRDPGLERTLHRSLRDWQPRNPVHHQHARIADAYRILGLIMLHQARRHVTVVDDDDDEDDEPPPLSTLVAQALHIIAADHVTASSTDASSGVYTRGIMLLAVGPEVSPGAGRAVITDAFARLHRLTRVNHFLLAARFVRDTCWPLRDRGVEFTWLDLLVRAGLTCVLI